MTLDEAIKKSESLCSINKINYCIFDTETYNKVLSCTNNSKLNDISTEWSIVSIDAFNNTPSIPVYYDTVTKETADKRQGKIISYLYTTGFEPSIYNNDSAVKYYTVESNLLFKIRLELSKNGGVRITTFDKVNDTIHVDSGFFNPNFIQHVIKDYLTIDEKREITLKKLFKHNGID